MTRRPRLPLRGRADGRRLLLALDLVALAAEGETEVDFGNVTFYLNGLATEGWMFVMRLSSRGFFEVLPGRPPKPALFLPVAQTRAATLSPGRMCDNTPAGGLAPSLGHRGHPRPHGVSLGAAGRGA